LRMVSAYHLFGSVPLGRSSSDSYCSFAYSALASFRMGMSGSASLQRAKKLHRLSHRANVALAVLAFIPAVIALVRPARAGQLGRDVVVDLLERCKKCSGQGRHSLAAGRGLSTCARSVIDLIPEYCAVLQRPRRAYRDQITYTSDERQLQPFMDRFSFY
jgi:hypothetical protein